MDQVTAAISKHMASPHDFIAVDGFCIWPKDPHRTEGIADEVRCGHLELVPPDRVPNVFDILRRQQSLSDDTMEDTLNLSTMAWCIAGTGNQNHEEEEEEEEGGEDASDYVYKSHVKVSDLADEAWRMWIAAYLLDDPSLCE